MKKRFVIGDIHGNYKALLQCLEKANFNYKKDELICLGDVCDGFPFVKDCFDELLKVKNLVYIIGNHDYWALDWYTAKPFPCKDGPPLIWFSQGGDKTIDSYGGIAGKMPKEHIKILKNAHVVLEESVNERKRLFVHGGIDSNKSIEKQDSQNCMWDRDLIYNARKKHSSKPYYKYGKYDEIFVGHTTTELFKSTEPLHYCNVWDLDTGAGWSGKLTIMNIDTKEYWQSDSTRVLYPDITGRR